jgi:hypothetical protein
LYNVVFLPVSISHNYSHALSETDPAAPTSRVVQSSLAYLHH